METDTEICATFEDNKNFEECYEHLEYLLQNFLTDIHFSENVPISNEINSACYQINQNYLVELRSLIIFMFSEIGKISNHFIQTMNYFDNRNEGVKVTNETKSEKEKELMQNTSNHDKSLISELVMHLKSTRDFIEKSSLILEDDEIMESNAKLIESMNLLLKSAKDKHIIEVNDLTFLIANKVVN